VRVLGIYSGDQRVGKLRLARVKGTWKGEDNAVRLSEEVDLRLSFRGDRFKVSSSQVSWIGEGMDLEASRGSMDFGAGSWETTAIKVKDRTYDREQVVSGSRTRDRIVIPEGATLSDVLPLYFMSSGLEEGEKEDLTVYNLTLGQEFPMLVEYRGKKDDGRLFAFTYWGMEERLWLDDTGMAVKEDMALGVNARNPGTDEQQGYLPLEKVLSLSAVPGVGIPGDLSELDEAVLLLEGTFRKPHEGRWQHVSSEGDLTAVTVRKPVIPPPGRRTPDMDLMPTDTVGLDPESGRIRDLAEDIAGPVDDPWEKAVALGKWVNEEIGKSMRECFSAVQVLEAGEGECQSHSLLMVALARAAGLPARFAYGVVYLPDRGVFGFHTWVQVHTGEWIPMDPTLGNFPAGPDHLTLAVGGYQDQFRLFPYIMGKGGWRIRFGERGTVVGEQ
jgi:hypothetical protein